MVRTDILRMRHPEQALKAVRSHIPLAKDPTVSIFFMPLIEQCPWKAAHSTGVALITDTIQDALGIPDNQRRTNTVSALLHDIGAVNNPKLPLEVINKQGPLTEGEFSQVMTHSREGFNRLISSGEPKLFPIALRVVGHHEHQGDRSYPRKKVRPDSKPEVVFGQRVIAVADTVDALLDPSRPYKKPWSSDKVRGEIGSKFGSFFSPQVLDRAVEAGVIFNA